MKKFKKLFVLLSATMMLMSCNNNVSSVSQTSNEESTEEEKEPLENGYYYKEIEFEDTGDTYAGFVDENDIPQGSGIMYYATGSVYYGDFVDGIPEGNGRFEWDSGCTYIGKMKDGLMHGVGYMYWPVGDYFYGEWKNGTFTYGTKYFLQAGAAIDGAIKDRYCIYFGEFDNNGLMSGWGTMHWPAGDYYEGEWSNNVRHGYGTQYWPVNDMNIPELMFVGQFSMDNGGWIMGEGTMYYKDGHIEKGTWNGTNKVSDDFSGN